VAGVRDLGELGNLDPSVARPSMELLKPELVLPRTTVLQGAVITLRS